MRRRPATHALEAQTTERGGKCNLALVGMMGSGKSTVGALLAERLGWTFLDTDLMLEAAFCKPVGRLFADGDETAFRSSERLVVRLLSSAREAVIATGGGLWLAPEIRERLVGFARTAYLAVPAAVLWRRVEAQGLDLRPLLLGPDPRGVLERLMAEREPIYGLADWRVDCGVSDPQIVVQQLFKKLKAAGLVARPGEAA